MSYQPKRSNKEYEDFVAVTSDYEGCSPGTLTCKVVKIRKARGCMDARNHDFTEQPVGTLCVCEKAVVDGKWCSCYTTVESLDAYMDQVAA